MKLSKNVLVPLVVVVVLLVAGGVWFLTSGPGDVSDRGSCGNATYELEVGEDDGQVEVSYELRSTSPGDAWDVVISQGDTVLVEVERVADDEAEVQAEAFAEDGGSSTFTVVATPAEGGDACETTVER